MNNIIIDPDLLEFASQEELENKAKAFDVLMKVLNNDYPLLDADKFIKITNGYNVIEIPLSDYEYKILERAMNK